MKFRASPRSKWSGFLGLICAAASLLSLTPTSAQPASVKDCLSVLHEKDYLSIAKQSNLHVDYLRSINAESYEQMKKDNKFDFQALTPYGAFGASDTYSQFNEKRQKYLETQRYTRDESQALNILKITTAPRSYTAYEACLRTVAEQGLVAWVSQEDNKTIELHVKFANPPGITGATMTGIVLGGAVAGAPKGRLWEGAQAWGVNEEKVFVVDRAPGSSETKLIIQSSIGAVFSQTYLRADGMLTLDYAGTTDVLVATNRKSTERTPNNDGRKKNCNSRPDGKEGKYCRSWTQATYSVAVPNYLKNPRYECADSGCGWSRVTAPPALSNGDQTASVRVQNWGPAATVSVVVDEYTRVGKPTCGGDGPIPVIFHQSVSFTVPKQCMPIAVLKWKRVDTASDGAVKAGAEIGPTQSLQLDGVVDSGSSMVLNYRLKD